MEADAVPVDPVAHDRCQGRDVGERAQRDAEISGVLVLQLRPTDAEHHRVGGARNEPGGPGSIDGHRPGPDLVGRQQLAVAAHDGREVHLERRVLQPGEHRDGRGGLPGRHEQVDVDHHSGGGIGQPARQQPVTAPERHRVDT